MLTKEVQEGHYKAVMVFPEIASWPQSDQFASKIRRAGPVTAKAFWVTPYLATVVPTYGAGSRHDTHWISLLIGEKRTEVLLLLQQIHITTYAFSRN